MTFGQTKMKNKTIKNAMKQTILFLLSLLAPACASAQVAKVYKNGVLVKAYTDTDTDKYKVVLGTHDYVEIGGLKWATMNIGATSISDETAYGDYYAWGETDTYYSSISNDTLICKYSDHTHIKGQKTGYNNVNYYGSNDASEWKTQPYDESYVLLPEYDIARQEWGGQWRMPNSEEINKLISACSDNADNPTYTTLSSKTSITKGGIYWVTANTTIDKTTYKVEGVLFVDKEDTEKRLFFPAAGITNNTKRVVNWEDSQSATYYRTAYWTSFAYTKVPAEYGMSFIVDSNNNSVKQEMKQRRLGLPVRPVCE